MSWTSVGKEQTPLCDLLLICCTACCTTNPQQIAVMEFALKQVERHALEEYTGRLTAERRSSRHVQRTYIGPKLLSCRLGYVA